MKAVACLEPLPIDDPRSLIDVELPDPVPTGRDLLVRVHAVSVNPRDVKSRQAAAATADAPLVLGYDACGVVERAGPDAALFKPGDEVFYAGVINRPGSNAELQRVDERIVGRKPGSLDHATAAALPLTALTAWEMLFDRLGIAAQGAPAGATVLILGGAGGVPSIAIQLARRAGLTVIATASRPESQAWVRELGAHHVIDHHQPLDDQIAQLPVGAVDYVFSTHTSQAVCNQVAKVMAPQGRFGLIDDPGPLDLRVFKTKSISIHWEAMFTRPLFHTADMTRQHEILNEVAALADAGLLRATATRNLGKIDAQNLRRAHALIETGRTVGKIVLAGF